MKKISLYQFLFCLLWNCFYVHAFTCKEPFQHRNQQPMAAIFLELTPLSACTVDAGSYQINSILQASNTILVFPQGDLPDAQIILDHERYEQTVSFRAGLDAKTDLGLVLRYVNEGPGNMDKILFRYHKFTGLSFDTRQTHQHTGYHYRLYNHNTDQIIETTAPQRGFGDVVIGIRQQLGTPVIFNFPILWSWRFEYKKASHPELPTISSGNSDAGLGLMSSVSGTLFTHPVEFWLNIGAVRTGKTRHSVYPQKPVFLSGGSGMLAEITEKWDAAIQILSASARYEVHEKIRGLNQRQSILVFGLRHITNSHRFSMGFTEDLDYYASEDFSILLEWQYSG